MVVMVCLRYATLMMALYSVRCIYGLFACY